MKLRTYILSVIKYILQMSICMMCVKDHKLKAIAN
jgi:hypothetical protein